MTLINVLISILEILLTMNLFKKNLIVITKKQ